MSGEVCRLPSYHRTEAGSAVYTLLHTNWSWLGSNLRDAPLSSLSSGNSAQFLGPVPILDLN